jgi:carbon storage regulator
MLVLSRKVLESIQVGDDIVVSVVEIRGGKVRIGIDAPKHVQIMRKEAAFGAGALPVDSDSFEKTES